MDAIRWSHTISYEDIKGWRRDLIQSPLKFSIDATLRDPGPAKPTKIMFKMGVWIAEVVAGNVDQPLRKIGGSAKAIEGFVGVNGDWREWECQKLEGEARVQAGRFIKLFELWTEKPVKPVRGGDKTFDLEVRVTFKLDGTPEKRIALLMDALLPAPLPRPGST